MIYDIAVVGCGGMGSAVLHHAALQGARVLGIEQFSLAHDRGSSHGHTRIIRQAYFEHPNYVPLLLEAYQLWAELEQQSGQQLYVQTGLLQSGPPDGQIVPGVLKSAAEYGLAIDHLSATQARERFPMFNIPSHHQVAFEHRAGYLLVERCVEVHLELARQSGATVLSQTPIINLDYQSDGILLQTESETFKARQVVLTAGAWLSKWLDPQLAGLQVLRKHLHWFKTSDERTHRVHGCPLFFFEDQVGYFYGFPAIDELGIKVAEHSGGEPLTDPSCLSRSIDSEDLARVRNFMSQTFYGQLDHCHHATCMYTMTTDQHFVMDRHPHDKRIWIAGGFSGHGFKFASVVGKLMALACLQQSLDQRLEFLSLNRSTLRLSH